MKFEKTFEVNNAPKKEDGTPKYTHIKIRLGYNIGGMNYFTKNAERRGYEILFRTITIDQEKGYETPAFLLSGDEELKSIKYLVQETKRQNNKLAAKLWFKLDHHTEELKDLYLAKDFQILESKIAELTTN